MAIDMEEFVEHLMYAWLCARDSKMNQTHPCRQGAPGLVEETQKPTTASGLKAVALESRGAVGSQRGDWPSLGRRTVGERVLPAPPRLHALQTEQRVGGIPLRV